MDFIGAKDDGGGGDKWSYMTCKAPVKLPTATNQHPRFTDQMPFLSPNQQCQSIEGKSLFVSMYEKINGCIECRN